jgi:hypothetical protein
MLAGHDVHALAEERFFWCGAQQGAQRVRLALTRDHAMFGSAADRIAAVARQVSKRAA